jgi:hypothetical protein
VSSINASRPATSPSSGSCPRSCRASRIASAVSSTRLSRAPELAVWPSLKIKYKTWSTAVSRAARSSGGGIVNCAPLSRIRCLARLIRWPTVASGTSSARAISAVVSPPTARSVSATWETGVNAGWQQSSNRVSSSSPRAGAGSGSRHTASSRRRRAVSLRSNSMRRRAATVISQFFGLSGTPSTGHCCAAASSASCTASSQVSKSP